MLHMMRLALEAGNYHDEMHYSKTSLSLAEQVLLTT